MKKLFFIIGISFLGLSACQEDTLVDDNPAPPEDNISVTLLPYYGGEPIKYDSIYTNSLGIQFYIDSVGLLISDVYFDPEDSDDLLDTSDNYMLLQTNKTTELNGLIPAGGYYGKFSLIYGSDTLYGDHVQEVLQIDPRLVRLDGMGFNFFTVKGRIFDPSEPPTDSVFIPVRYTLGTYHLTDTATSELRYFNVDNANDVPLFLYTEIKPLLHYLNMDAVQEVKSDFFDNQDWTIAEIMSDSLTIGVF